MTPTEYIGTVLQREAPTGPVLERLAANPELLYILNGVLNEGVGVADRQDRVKRAIFYGKTKLFFEESNPICKNPWTDALVAKLKSDPRLLRFIHAFLGKLGEAGELQKQIREAVFNNAPLDTVNINEELGDDQWYTGVALDANQTSFETIWVQNDAKLEKRMGQKFSAERVNNRDLAAERAVLEGFGSVTKKDISTGTIEPGLISDAAVQLNDIGSIPKAKISGGTLGFAPGPDPQG